MCFKMVHFNTNKKNMEFVNLYAQPIKDYRYHDFPNTEFSYFLTIVTR